MDTGRRFDLDACQPGGRGVLYESQLPSSLLDALREARAARPDRDVLCVAYRMEEDGREVARIGFAFDCGSSVVSLIPTRTGNGALDALAASGEFVAPTLAMLEESVALGVSSGRGRVFADLWDLARLRDCEDCFDARAERLERINLEQRVPAPVSCAACGGGR